MSSLLVREPFLSPHGNHRMLAFYFDDPEGKLIGVYWATDVDVRQPYGHPIDLDLPEEELLRDVARVAEAHGLPVPLM